MFSRENCEFFDTVYRQIYSIAVLSYLDTDISFPVYVYLGLTSHALVPIITSFIRHPWIIMTQMVLRPAA